MIPSSRDLLLTSLKVGCLGFGGPAGQIALMHRVFVEEKRWIDEPRYLHALGFCTLLPGPEAQQLATYVGWTLRGWWGGLTAGLMFVLPGAAVMFALSWLYAAHGEALLVAAAFDGVKAAVLALVLEAVVRLGRRALAGWSDWILAIAAFAAMTLVNAPFPLIVLVAAAVGAVRGKQGDNASTEVATPLPRKRRTLATIAFWCVIWLAPLVFSIVALGGDHWLSRLGGVFAALAATSFGGAYALLAWLQQQAVETYGWLTTAQMVDGLGLAETTPGPLVLVNPFVGFMAGWNASGGGLAWAAAGSLMALWQTFAPSFLYIFAGAPYADALRRSRLARGALAGVMAAVLGVIAGLALWFGRHVLLPEGEGFDIGAAAIAVVAAIALMRFRVNVVLVVALCAITGIARGLLA